MIKANVLFEIWAPDLVAECLSYPDQDHKIYSQLWDLVHLYKKTDSEYPSNDGTNALFGFWDKLPDETKVVLNAAAEKLMYERGERMTPQEAITSALDQMDIGLLDRKVVGDKIWLNKPSESDQVDEIEWFISLIPEKFEVFDRPDGTVEIFEIGPEFTI